jgi:Protein of unknown function (DUF1364)
MNKLREAAEGQSCVRCGAIETVVLCHYTGYRRHAYGGGLGIKVHDLVGAHLCFKCHRTMDTLSRNKEKQIEHSESFQHLCLLTLLRLWEQEVVGDRTKYQPVTDRAHECPQCYYKWIDPTR